MHKIWFSHRSPGIPAEIDPDRYGSVLALFERATQRFGQFPAFTHRGTTLSFADLDALSRDLAAYLQKALGLGKGDCVAIMLPNLLQWPVALFAAMRTGARITNINPQYTAAELSHQLNDADVKVIILCTESTPQFAQIQTPTKLKSVIVTAADDLSAGGPKSNGLNAGVSLMIDFCSALRSGNTLQFDSVAICSDDILFLQYTGGTTGRPKGAVLTHRNVVANLLQFSAMYDRSIEAGKETIITALPLYHIFALTCNCLALMRHGAHNILISDPRDLAELVREWGHWPCSVFTGVNTLYNGLLNTVEFRALDFGALKLCIGGGAAIQTAVAEQWTRLTGCSILVGYGLSETSPLVTTTPHNDTEFTGSIGIPVPSTEISLRDERGDEVAIGEPGQLCIKGPQVMRGYWRQEQATKEAMTVDGFFQTGDIATVDEAGYFRIVDRKKDMILMSGFNVFPNEIEEVVAQCQGVLENACIGVPDARTGEAVKVFVVLKPRYNLNSAAIRSHCIQLLTPYKVPKHIEFIDALPKSTVGKILRRKLRRLEGSG